MWNSDGNKAGRNQYSLRPKRRVKKMVAFLLLVSMVGSVQVMPVRAADFCRSEYVSQLKVGKSKTLKGYKEQFGVFQAGVGFVETGGPWGNSLQTVYDYKIRIPKDCIMKISFVSSKKGINVSLRGSNKLGISSFESTGKKYTGSISIKKGTYYLQNQKPTSVKCKFKLEKVKDYKNYTVEKAKGIRAKKKISVSQLGNHNYVKWYRIYLTKRQKIAIKGQAFKQLKKMPLEDCITLYDDEGEEISPSGASIGKLTFEDSFSEVLEPGDYYLRVDYFDHVDERHWFFHGTYLGQYSHDRRVGNSVQFYWY